MGKVTEDDIKKEKAMVAVLEKELQGYSKAAMSQGNAAEWSVQHITFESCPQSSCAGVSGERAARILSRWQSGILAWGCLRGESCPRIHYSSHVLKIDLIGARSQCG